MKYAIVALVLVGVLWGWLSAFAYFDPLAFCRIHIDVELLEGDRSPTRRAINLVRREDPLAYKTLCRYVDRIMEEPRCQAGDAQADPAFRGQPAHLTVDPVLRRALDAPGCYVKGSRIVILKRQASAADDTSVRQRAETLKRLAGYSAAFWADRVLAR